MGGEQEKGPVDPHGFRRVLDGFRGFLVGLVGIDSDDIKTWAEAVMPVTMLLSVALNAAFAAGTFPVAARIMYPDMPESGLALVAVLGAALVGLVDWMVVSSHPNLPDWWSAGLQPPRWYQFLYGERSTDPASRVDGVAGTRGIRDYATPKQPGFWARLVQFAPRLLLTAVLAVVIGTCVSIGADATAVKREMDAKQQRLEAAARVASAAAMDAVALDAYSKAKTAYDDRGTAKTKWLSDRDTLQKQATQAQADADALRAQLEKIALQIKCESGEAKCVNVTGNPNSEGVRRNQEDYAALKPRWVEANRQAEEARKKLEALKEPADQGDPPVQPVKVDPKTMPFDSQPVVGMAETLNAYFVAAAGWPWYLRWGPHIVMLAIDLTPLLMRLSHGNASHERRRWDRLCLETNGLLSEAWANQAELNQLLHRSDGAVALTKARHETDMVIASIEKDQAADLHEEIAERWKSLRLEQTDATIERTRAFDQQVAADQLALDQASWSAELTRRWAEVGARAGSADGGPPSAATSPAAPFVSDTPTPQAPSSGEFETRSEGHTPFSAKALLAPWVSDQAECFDETSVVVWGDAQYITGPSLLPVLGGSNTWARGEVLFAVKVPERRGEMITPDRLHTICGVVKRSVNEVPRELVGNSLGLVAGDNATVKRDKQGGTLGRLLMHYYPRTDLERHLNQLSYEGASVEYADVARVGANLCVQNLNLNQAGWILLDGKPRNFLAAGMMTPVTRGESALVGDAMGSVMLADFDNVSKPGPTKLVMTPQWAPPEFLDPPTAARREAPEQGGRFATPAVDVFAIAASMLYCATGQRLSDHMKPHANVIDFEDSASRPSGWWAPAYTRSFREVMDELLGEVPVGLARALRAGLEPNPSDRVDMWGLCDLFREAAVEAGSRMVAIDTLGPRPNGYGPSILAHVRRVGYNLVIE